MIVIKKGADDWNWGMCGAAEGGQMDLVKFFIEKGSDNLLIAIQIAEKHNQPLIEKFLRGQLVNSSRTGSLRPCRSDADILGKLNFFTLL